MRVRTGSHNEHLVMCARQVSMQLKTVQSQAFCHIHCFFLFKKRVCVYIYMYTYTHTYAYMYMCVYAKTRRGIHKGTCFSRVSYFQSILQMSPLLSPHLGEIPERVVQKSAMTWSQVVLIWSLDSLDFHFFSPVK